jgi:hypothetical protein
LHRLLRDRVARCSSLLTVEQLVALARRLEQEKQQQQHRRQRELVQRLLQQSTKPDTPQEAAEPGHEDDEPMDSAPLPPGSISLGLASPLDVSGLNWSLDHRTAEAMAGDPWGSSDGPGDGQRDDEPLNQDDSALEADPEAPSGAEGDASASQQEAADAAELMAALIEGLFEAGAWEGGEPDTDENAGPDASGRAALAGSSERGSGSGRQAGRPAGAMGGQPAGAGLLPGGGGDTEPEGLLLEAGLSRAGENDPDAGSPWEEPGLPRDPLLLLRWLDGLEAALARRLRNLSHAINVDLLRLGLTRGLLPVSLLEAVLQGQIETLASPSNVVRLQLPFGLHPGAPPLQAIAILLRPVDLEMEEPRLRTCRRRIHQHRQQVRKMAQTYRRLQRRLQAHEAERLWLQDIRASRTPGI